MNQGGRRTLIMINRPDKHIAWSLMPQSKQCMEMPMDEDSLSDQLENWEQNLKKAGKFLGQETVNGVKCNNYERSDKDQEKVTCWISRKDKIQVSILSGEYDGGLTPGCVS